MKLPETRKTALNPEQNGLIYRVILFALFAAQEKTHFQRFNILSKLKPKYVSESKTEQVQIVMSGDINGNGRLFGGRLAEWIDVVAAVVARRHSNREVTTVFIDNLHFKAPAYINDTVVLIGSVTYVGNTSIEVKVDTYAENLLGERRMINKAYVVLVALDENEKPVSVPTLIIENEEQKAEWQAGEKRRALQISQLVKNR